MQRPLIDIDIALLCLAKTLCGNGLGELIDVSATGECEEVAMECLGFKFVSLR